MAGKEIKDAIALVSGAGRGLGKAFVEELLKSGAGKIYAGIRKIEQADLLLKTAPEKIIPIKLDITDADSVQKAAEKCTDVNLLINNAGICYYEKTLEACRLEMETNCFGSWSMCNAFTPVLAQNGGGVIVNMLSMASYSNMPWLGSYSVTKAAAHSMTQLIRTKLIEQNTLVIGVYAGLIDTEMAENVSVPKTLPSDVARAALEGIQNGKEEVFPDTQSHQMYKDLFNDPKAFENQMREIEKTLWK